MTTWKTEKPNEHRFDLGAGDILVVHGCEVSRAHMHILPTFWRTDGSDMPPDVRAQALAIPLEYMRRHALEQARDVLRAALAAVETGLAPSAEPIVVGDVTRAESALANANVPPPYELRATAGALAGLAVTLAERCKTEATEPEHWAEPTLQPGETLVGRIGSTFLIAVDPPPPPAFRVSGGTPVGEAVYEPGKGPPIFAR